MKELTEKEIEELAKTMHDLLLEYMELKGWITVHKQADKDICENCATERDFIGQCNCEH